MRSVFAFLLIALVACSGENQMTSNPPPNLDYAAKAKEFAEALVANNYDAAFEMLSSSLKPKLTAAELQSRFTEMTEYGEGRPRVDGHVQTMEDWPGKQPSDVGWAYVSISGDDFAEAVTVVVNYEDDAMKIREVEWGRP